MKIFGVAFAAAAIAVATAQLARAAEFDNFTTGLPDCAATCYDAVYPYSACATSTNETCVCWEDSFTDLFQQCIDDQCTIRQGLTAKNITTRACNEPVRDKRARIIWVASVGMVIAYAAIFLRLYTRQFVTQGGMGYDDWCTVVIAVFLAPISAGAILLAKAGLGKDVWTLPFHAVDHTLYLFYVQEHLYIICAVLTKLALLLFYMRIFPSQNFQRVVYATVAFALCFGVGVMFAFAFQCTPISRMWEGWDNEHPGTCVNINAMVMTAAVLNILADFWIIVLPIPGVVQLQSSVRMRLQISAMFCTGFFITGVSIYRAIMLIDFNKTGNPTWDYCDGGYWSIIEVDVGILCTCMPAIRSLLGRIIPRVFGTTRKSEGYTSGPSKRTGDGRGGSQTPNYPASGGGGGGGDRVGKDDASFVQLIDMDATTLHNIETGSNANRDSNSHASASSQQHIGSYSPPQHGNGRSDSSSR